jgi:hypothetical protein
MATDSTNTDSPRTIWSEFETWSALFKPWQKFALCNIIRTGSLTDDQIGSAYAQFLYDHDLGIAPEPSLDIPATAAGRPATAPQGATALKALSDLRGVNALPATAALVFSSGLTVIYGGNGVGKSGFARVLSSGCFCRNPPTVLPNIYADGPHPTLSAKVTITGADGKDVEYELKPGNEIPDLKRISVFDSIEARSYLTEQNPLGFKPVGFDVFPELASAYAKLLDRLNAEIALRTRANNFPLSFIAPESEVSRFVSCLNSSTSIEELNKLANFGEVEIARLVELGRQITDLQTQSTETALTQLGLAKLDLVAVQTQLESALTHTLPEARSADRDLIDEYQKRVTAVSITGSDSFKRSFFTATGSAVWERFLATARELAVQEDPAYPKPDAHCLLCHQRLDTAGHDLIHRYWQFLESDVKIQAESAKAALVAVADELRKANWNFFGAETTAFATVTRLRPELVGRLQKSIEAGMAYCNATIAMLEASGPPLVPPAWDDLTLDLAGLLEQIEVDISTLKGSNAAEAIAKLESERVLLRHRQVLNQLRGEIETWITDQKWAASGIGLRRFLSPRAITDKEKDLFETVIADGYRTRFAEECKGLNCEAPVEMHTQGQRGQTVRSLKMKGHKPDQILSEGEQRAVALADFLTEVALNPSATGIILDDPVNSQDHERKRLIATRLVNEAKRRQVIVFTHDMVFLARLVELAPAEASLMTHWVERDSDGKPGQVTLDDSPAESKQYRKTDKATATLVDAKAAAGSERHRLVQRGMAELRRTLEEIVPHFVFQQVVGRWNDRVMVTALKKVKWDDALVTDIVSSYEELSGYIEGHTHPEESAGAPPDPPKLETLIARVADIIRRAKVQKS